MTRRPPALASWLLTRAVAEHRQEELLGDLEELFQVHSIDRGRAAAQRWYWRQAVRAIVDAVRNRPRQPRTPAGDSLMMTLAGHGRRRDERHQATVAD